MILCEKCFCDTEVISIIRGKGEKGSCPLCGSNNVYIYDTEKYEDLSIRFDDLLNLYTPVSMLPDLYPKEQTFDLTSELLNNWNIFKSKSKSDVHQIITVLCKEKYETWDWNYGHSPASNYTYAKRFDGGTLEGKETASFKNSLWRPILLSKETAPPLRL